MTESSPLPKRKRGGQPGNANARKHGLYTRSFRRLEAARLEAALPGGLKDEVSLLRVLVLRTMLFLKDNPPETSKEQLSALRQVTQAVARLQHLTRFRQATHNVDATLEKLLDELKHLPFKQE